MLKTIALATVALIAGVLLYAATRPDSFRVERSTRIEAPAEKIFPLINDLRAWNGWSPYDAKDPAMQRTFSGAASGPGAVYAWNGNRDVGQGRMEILAATPPSQVTVRLDFIQPFQARNMAEFTLRPDGNGNGTDVTWALHGPSPYISKLMGLVFNLDHMVGKDFEVGLANLKRVAEQH